MSFNKCLIIDILFHVLIVNNIFFFGKNKKKINKGYHWSPKFCNHLFPITAVVSNTTIS